VQSDLATFGGWCVLAGVFLMVSGDGLTNFSEPNPSAAWPWLYLIPFAASLPLMVIADRAGVRKPSRGAILYPPLVALLAAFAVSTVFSQVHVLSTSSLCGLVGIATFWWYLTQVLEDDWLANATWIVVAFAVLQLAAEVIAARLAEGIDQIPLHIQTVAWLGKLQITWVLNLIAPFLLARFIGDPRPWVSWLNGIAWIAAGIANFLLLARMGTIVFVLTTIAVCLLNLKHWRRWIWMMGTAAVAGAFMIANNLRTSTFVLSTIFDRSQNAGIDLRLQTWGEAWQLFLAHPLVGIGIGTFDEVAYQMPGTVAIRDFYNAGWHAYNVPLHIMTEAGVLGLAAWAFLWYIVLTALARAWRSGDAERRLFSSAALVSVIAFQVLSMTEVLLAARVHASVRMNLLLALLVVAGLRMSLPARYHAEDARSS
jgi:O-antigen ligase